MRSCFSLPPSVYSIYLSPLGKKRKKKKWRGASAILLGFPSTTRFKGCSHSILFHSHSCPSPMRCPFFYPLVSYSHFWEVCWVWPPEEISGTYIKSLLREGCSYKALSQHHHSVKNYPGVLTPGLQPNTYFRILHN